MKNKKNLIKEAVNQSMNIRTPPNWGKLQDSFNPAALAEPHSFTTQLLSTRQPMPYTSQQFVNINCIQLGD